MTMLIHGSSATTCSPPARLLYEVVQVTGTVSANGTMTVRDHPFPKGWLPETGDPAVTVNIDGRINPHRLWARYEQRDIITRGGRVALSCTRSATIVANP